MRYIFLWFFFLLAIVQTEAQNKPIQLGKTASDCIGALEINDTIVGPVFSPVGHGNRLEIDGYELGDPFFIQREHNTVWYRFTVPYDAVFSFDLVPVIKDDDFDFLLFRYDGPNFCRDIADGRKIPIRTNISRKNTLNDGKTGLSEDAVDKYVPSGPGSPYSQALNVVKGEVYYLLVDNPYRENKGHSIILYFRKLKEGHVTIPEPDPVYISPIRKLIITVTDIETGDRLASDIFLDEGSGSEKMRFPVLSQVEADVVSYRTYYINVIRQGYLLATETFVPKNDSIYDIDIKLKKMSLGDRINLQNIKFDSDKTVILAESQSALDQLKNFMDINPGMHIELQGHVNGESKRNKKKYRKLSAARAEAIYRKLTEAGIDNSRIRVVGFGNARMMYPTPVNNRQAEANRRVEAEVTKL